MRNKYNYQYAREIFREWTLVEKNKNTPVVLSAFRKTYHSNRFNYCKFAEC